jgi:hypothetical protein
MIGENPKVTAHSKTLDRNKKPMLSIFSLSCPQRYEDNSQALVHQRRQIPTQHPCEEVPPNDKHLLAYCDALEQLAKPAL